MPGLLIFPRGEVLFADIPEDRRCYPPAAGHLAIGAISHATAAPIVVIAIPTASGQWVLGETDLALLLTAAEAFVAVHGDPRGPRPFRFPPFESGAIDPADPRRV
jgi:hypothetical protein